MVEADNEVLQARKEYFDTLNKKNYIDHTRIDQLDLDNIGIVLNYQQVDLINIAISSNKVSYKEYQSKLIKMADVETDKGKRDRWILILKELIQDDLPEKTKEVITKIYEQTKINPTITAFTIEDVLNKLIAKLSTDLQDLLYNKISKLGNIAKEGMKEMSIEEALKLFTYIEKDYTTITIKDAANVEYYMNPNGSYNKDKLKNMLDFAYDNDKAITIDSLLSETIPSYFKGLHKDIIKQKLITYVDEITKYFTVYNSTHKRIDRKPVIRMINAFNNLNNSEWLKVLSLEDICDIVQIIRKNAPEILICYNECGLENNNKRKNTISNILQIQKYGKKKSINLIDIIGTAMHVDLDITKDDIIKMFEELSEFKLKIAVTEFDVSPNEDMLFNNSRKEIEILRERFISDLCNIITNLSLSKVVDFDSVSIDSICDNQSHRLTIVNRERKTKKLPLFRTFYSGMYDPNMDRKEEKFINSIKLTKSNTKGFAETMYIGTIILGLLIVIAIVVLIFLQFI